jgi:acylphosphatase
MAKHFEIYVYGRVHNVTFRHNAVERARSLGLTGFVRNEPDGSLSIEVEGEEAGLQNFITWCRKGPRFAKVERLEIQEAPLKHFTAFEIRTG